MLPRASIAQSLQKQQVQLSITKDKEYFINQQMVPFESLESTLINTCKQIAEPTVVVRADYSLSIQELVNVLQIGTKLKLKMVLATDKSK
jgi:biopolymer transport protein ExbD